MSPPAVTVILPTFQRPILLARALRSLTRQTFEDFIVKVYDNDSGDNTAAVVAELSATDPRFHYECRERNIGGFENFQRALAVVETEYFCFLSDDDALMPSFLEGSVRVLREHVEAAMVASKVGLFSDDLQIIGMRPKVYQEQLLRPPQGFAAMLDVGIPTWTGVLFRREVLDSVGLLDERMGRSGDFDFLLRVASQYPYYTLNRVGGLFAARDDRRMAKTALLFDPEGRARFLSKVEDGYAVPSSMSRPLGRLFRRKFLRRLASTIKVWLARGELDLARQGVSMLRTLGDWKRATYFQVLSYAVERFSPIRKLLGFALEQRMCRKAGRKREFEGASDIEQFLQSIDHVGTS